MQEAVLVVNPISGNARRRDAVERYVSEVERHGVEVRVHPTRAAGDGARAARLAAESGARVVIAAGGDGTVNEVASGLIAAGTGTPLAVLPLGTANLVARHLGIPRSAPEAAAAAVLDPAPVTVDVGRIADRTFVACAGVGLDANIVAELSARRRGHIGYLSYVVPMWRTVRRYTSPLLRVRDDSGRCVEGTQVLVLNMRPYASFLEPAPEASATDGLLDVVVLAGSGLVRTLRWSARAIRSRLLEDPDATHLRCRRVEVAADVPAPVQIDGDVGGVTPVDILVVPHALRIVRPPVRADGRAP